MDMSSAPFWAALGSIILANVLLSGDNAVVIALAARGLPEHQQRKAMDMPLEHTNRQRTRRARIEQPMRPDGQRVPRHCPPRGNPSLRSSLTG